MYQYHSARSTQLALGFITANAHDDPEAVEVLLDALGVEQGSDTALTITGLAAIATLLFEQYSTANDSELTEALAEFGQYVADREPRPQD